VSIIKIWNDREDNEHFIEVLDVVELDSTNVRGDLYNSLKARYLLIVDGQ
jgi:hypothetical protein